MTEKTSVNKKILFKLDVFTQIKSLFEMLSDSGLTIENSLPDIKIILVQDSIGSEFLEFFRQEIYGKFQVRELICKEKKLENQLEEIGRVFENDEENEKENKKNDEQLLESSPDTSIIGKTILLMNNPIYEIQSEQERLVNIVKFISGKLYENSKYIFLLRILQENAPRELIEMVDFSFIIPYPTKIQRITIFETLLKELNVHTVDITHLSDLTEEKWNVIDLKRLVDRAFIQWKLLNYIEFKTQLEQETTESIKTTSEEEVKTESKPSINEIPKIPFSTEIFSELIAHEKVLPLGKYPALNEPIKILKTQKNAPILESHSQQSPKISMKVSDSMEGLGLAEIDSFTSSQLYQYAAANKFEELTSTLEKLDQGKKLDKADRRILADYAFILKDPPNRALLKLTNARKTIDRIQNISER
jgi:hypothetical protein